MWNVGYVVCPKLSRCIYHPSDATVLKYQKTLRKYQNILLVTHYVHASIHITHPRLVTYARTPAFPYLTILQLGHQLLSAVRNVCHEILFRCRPVSFTSFMFVRARWLSPQPCTSMPAFSLPSWLIRRRSDTFFLGLPNAELAFLKMLYWLPRQFGIFWRVYFPGSW